MSNSFVSSVDLTIGADNNSSSYNNLEKDEQKRIRLSRIRPSRMNLMISNPRLSTFQELTPTAGAFHSAPRAAITTRSPPGIKVPHYQTHSQRHPLSNVQFLGVPDMSQFASATEMSTNNQRVTVLYDVDGGPPLLHMRFSTLDVPSPSLLANGAQTHPADTSPSPKVDTSQADDAPLSCPPGQLFSSAPFELDLDDDDLTMPKRPFADERRTSGSSGMSTSSVTSMVEIISAPRRTISQRRAEARVFRANSVKAQVEYGDEKRPSNRPAFDTSNGNDVAATLLTPSDAVHPYGLPTWGEQMRTSSAGTFGPSDAIPIEAHSRTESQCTSINSATDSIQAVQELASQFPCLPPPASAMDTEFEVSEESCEEIRCPSGVFGYAIGSPAELRDARSRSRLRSFAAVPVSFDGASSFAGRQPSTDAFLASRFTAAGSIPQTPLLPHPAGPLPPNPWSFAVAPASSLSRQSDGFHEPLSKQDLDHKDQSLDTHPISSFSDETTDNSSVLSFSESQRNSVDSCRGSTISTCTVSPGREQVTPRVQPIVISPETPNQVQAFRSEAMERVKSRDRTTS